MRIELISERRGGNIIASVDLDPSRVRGSRNAFGPVLHIGIQVDYDPSKHQPILFEGTLSWPNEQYGLAIPMQTIGGGTAELMAPISDAQIVSLERKRAGRELRLRIDLRAVGTPDEKGVVGRYKANYVPDLALPRDVWKSALDGFGVGIVRIVQLPTPPESPSEAWSRASEQIEKASQFLADGRNGESVTSTRIALERTAEAVGEVLGVSRNDSERFAPYLDRLASHLKDRNRGSDPFALIGNLLKDGQRLDVSSCASGLRSVRTRRCNVRNQPRRGALLLSRQGVSFGTARTG